MQFISTGLWQQRGKVGHGTRGVLRGGGQRLRVLCASGSPVQPCGELGASQSGSCRDREEWGCAERGGAQPVGDTRPRPRSPSPVAASPRGSPSWHCPVKGWPRSLYPEGLALQRVPVPGAGDPWDCLNPPGTAPAPLHPHQPPPGPGPLPPAVSVCPPSLDGMIRDQGSVPHSSPGRGGDQHLGPCCGLRAAPRAGGSEGLSEGLRLGLITSNCSLSLALSSH